MYFFYFFCLAFFAAIIYFIARHFFNMKYPETESHLVISLPVMQILLYCLPMSIWYGSIYGEALLYSRPSDNHEMIMTISSFVVTISIFVIPICLLIEIYRSFNFAKYKFEQLNKFAKIATFGTMAVCIAVAVYLCSFASEHNEKEVYEAVIGLVASSGLLYYWQKKYEKEVPSIFNTKYSHSIQSVVVTNLTKMGENIDSQSSQQQQNQSTAVSIKSKAESLRDIKELLDTGALTQEEFDKIKKEILNSK